jgi:predicted nucleotidyltransferase
MAVAEITDAVQHYLTELPAVGIHPTAAVLYGSQARGNAHEWSDIDVVVVAPEFDGTVDRSLVKRLWRALVHADNRIEPIACGTLEWERETNRPIIDIARREGVMILPRGAA